MHTPTTNKEPLVAEKADMSKELINLKNALLHTKLQWDVFFENTSKCHPLQKEVTCNKIYACACIVSDPSVMFGYFRQAR